MDKDEMIGTIELTMIKEEKIWKIDNLNIPKLDKLELSQENKKLKQHAES